MSLLTRKRKILAKIETAYGTDSMPVVGTDAVLLRSLVVTPLEVTYDQRTLIRSFIGGFADVVGMKMVKIEAEMEMAGFGSAGPATPTPGYDAMLRACAFAHTITATTKVVYTPVSDAFDSVTVYYEKDGVLQKAVGCRGNLTLSMAEGKIPSYKITLQGVYAGVADSNIGVPVTTAFVQPVAVNSGNTTGLSILGYAGAILRSFSLDTGNKVDMSTYVGDAETVRVTDRAVVGKMSVEATTVAAQDWLTKVLSVTTGPFSITHGPATNQVVIAGPSVQLTNPKESDDKGIAFMDFDLRFLPSAGNDEVTVTIQ